MLSRLPLGVNAYQLYKNFNSSQSVEISSTNEIHEFACIQLQNTLMGRGDIIKETKLQLRVHGIFQQEVTLHVGLGSFYPRNI